MDLKQQGLNGINAAIYIRNLKSNHHQIIFLTADMTHAIKAINLHTQAFGYVWKKERDSLDILVDKILKAKTVIESTTDKINEKYLIVYPNRKPERIAAGNIVYFQLVKDKTVEIHAIKNNALKVYSTTSSLAGVYSKIGDNFFRINRVLYINMLYVGEVIPESEQLDLNYGICFDVTQKKLEDLLRCMKNNQNNRTI